jgi:hypothetical protein
MGQAKSLSSRTQQQTFPIDEYGRVSSQRTTLKRRQSIPSRRGGRCRAPAYGEICLRHPLYDAVDRIVYVAGENVARHHLRDRQLPNGNSTFRNSAYDVALRQNSGETPAGAKDHQRADTMLGKHLAAAARSAVKSMLTTSLPFAARMVFKVMPGSVRGHFTPILGMGARCVYREGASK